MKYTELREYLSRQTVTRLKQNAKTLQIKGVSNCRKNDVVQNILVHFAAKPIQRFLRKCFSVNENCLISLDPITYPCWGKKTKISKRYYYYNLIPLVDYILDIGLENACDPVLKEKYTLEELHSIDVLYKKNQLYKRFGHKNLLKALKRTTFYRIKHDEQERIDILIDCIRRIMCDMKNKIDYLNNEIIPYTLDYNQVKRELAIKFQNVQFDLGHLYRINRDWCKKTFKMMNKIISEIGVENELKQECFLLVQKEKNKYVF